MLNIEFSFLSIPLLFRTYKSIIMEHILDEAVSNEDLKKFEQKYHEELNHGKVGGRLKLKVNIYRLHVAYRCLLLLQLFPFTRYYSYITLPLPPRSAPHPSSSMPGAS